MKYRLPLIAALLMALGIHTQAQAAAQGKAGHKTAQTVKGKKGSHNGKRAVQQAQLAGAAVRGLGHETVLEAGCMDPETMAQIDGRLQLQALKWQDDEVPTTAGAATCRHYAAAVTQRLVRNTLALLNPVNAEGGLEAVIYSRAANDAASAQTRWPIMTEAPRLRQIASANLRSDGLDLQDIPSHLQWELDLIAKKMISSLRLEPTAHHLRITLSPEPGTGLEKIFAIELLESASAQRVEAAIWLDRKELPGAYFSLKGIEYERLLWQSPVQNARISRGVGPSVTTMRRRVAVKTAKSAKPRMAIRTFRVRGQHIGIDFAAPLGTPVAAVADGEVVHVGPNGGYGNLIIIDHGDGHHTYYAHLSAYAQEMRIGLQVRRGEEIGQVGSTGFSTGPHLHFEIRKDDRYIDPTNRQSQLRFWNLAEQEQSDVVARLMRLQIGPGAAPAVIEASRGQRLDQGPAFSDR